ncbi:YgaP family membrane protein [Calditrichota bacterium LG25]
MNKNVGGIDRWIRIVLGIVLIALVFVGPQIKWGWIGLVPLLTGIVGFCPAYLPFKFSTYKES